MHSQTSVWPADEPSWIRWRLWLSDCDQGLFGLLGGGERHLELRGRQVTAVTVEPHLVEPVHPRERGELEVLDAVPAVAMLASTRPA